jgi:phosphomannomutase/phosphoglucomutase
MFFADRYFGFDDAIYSSLRLLEIMCKDERPVSEYLKDLPRMYSTPEIRIECPDTIKFEVVKRLTDYYKKRFDIIDIDGVRVVLKEGWGLVRPSNTQRVLVLRFEAEGMEALEVIKGMVISALNEILNQMR